MILLGLSENDLASENKLKSLSQILTIFCLSINLIIWAKFDSKATIVFGYVKIGYVKNVFNVNESKWVNNNDHNPKYWKRNNTMTCFFSF